MNQQVYTIGQFAKKVSVTVRALRYYDQVKLLCPSHYSEGGHRLYTDSDLLKLQQILALKFLGFSLEEIKRFLKIVPGDFTESLRIQEEILRKKRDRINQVIEAIREIEPIATEVQDWDKIVEVIKVIQMKQDDNWWEKYYEEGIKVAHSEQGEAWMRQTYTEEQLSQIKERQQEYSLEQAYADGQRWKELILKLKQLVASGKDPSSVEAQELAHSWLALVSEFTGGDKGIQQSLEKGMKARNFPFPRLCTEQEEQFIENAIQLYQK